MSRWVATAPGPERIGVVTDVRSGQAEADPD